MIRVLHLFVRPLADVKPSAPGILHCLLIGGALTLATFSTGCQQASSGPDQTADSSSADGTSSAEVDPEAYSTQTRADGVVVPPLPAPPEEGSDTDSAVPVPLPEVAPAPEPQ